MKRTLLSLMLSMAASAALVAAPGSPPAAAQSITFPPRVACPGMDSQMARLAERAPYLLTPFGPLSICYQAGSSYNRARIGYYSPVRDRFIAQSSWLTRNRAANCPCGNFVRATDGWRGRMTGTAAVLTQFGPANWGIQFNNERTRGRFGARNLITGKFYPSSRWYDVVRLGGIRNGGPLVPA